MTFPTTPRLTIAFYLHSVPFTRDVLEHQTSLGGSESACRVLAEALAARGHDVHVFATQLEAPAEYFGVFWHRAEEMAEVFKFAPPDVFVSLRMPHIFQQGIPAKLRVFWTQDLLVDQSAIGPLYAVDKTVFVSGYHREQWCNLQPLLRPTAWVTRNPIAPADLAGVDPFAGHKVRRRLIHISRPERGVDGILALWPEIRQRWPDATIALCRYNSMYDKGGWGQVCAAYDQKLEKLNADVGGITFLGELNKTQLYAEIAQSVAMLYPTTQANFAETNCVAATEAQACGTPIIATRRGALPETVDSGAGLLIDGDVLADAATRTRFLDAIGEVFDAQEHPDDTFDRYARMQQRGRLHAMRSYGDVVAQAWEQMLLETFAARYEANKVGVLRQLLHWDNHAAAQIVANDLIATHPSYPPNGGDGTAPELVEARDAEALCERVIRQEEQTAEHYAAYAIQDPAREAEENGRMHVAADRIAETLVNLRAAGQLRDRDGTERPARILDVSCGNGSMALCLAERVPADTIIHGVDYAAGVIELARTATAHLGRRARFWTISDSQDLAPFIADRITAGDLALGEHYDAVFCGEFIEHIPEPWKLLDALERVTEPEGTVVLTTPCGPFGELLARHIPRQRGHVHAFSLRDLTTMCEGKRNFGWQYLSIGESPRGTACGYWLFGFQPGGAPAAPIDYATSILLERPYQRLHAAMIVKDGAPWLRKCLDSLYGVVDAVRIIDFGSTDGSVAIAESLGAEVLSQTWPADFSVARNRSLEFAGADAEWVLWIDADEHLQNPEAVRRYIVDGGLFTGYVVRQQHLSTDQPPFADKPVRLFRTNRGIRFYGVVHEQPEQVMNEGIVPALDQQDFRIIHLGYEDEPTRRHKMKVRNLPLLMKEITGQGTHPPRRLAWVLYLRDCVNLAAWEQERTPGRRNRAALVLAQRAVGVYHQQRFDDPTTLFHELAWPFYQQALTLLGQGVEVAWTFAAAPGRLADTVQPRVQKFKVSSLAEITQLTGHQIGRWTKELEGEPIDIEPLYSVAVPAATLSTDAVRKVVRAAAPHSWGDDRRIMEWAALFLEAVQTAGDLPVLEVGTWKGASALVWLELLTALGRTTPVITVDPYGGKPYRGGNGDGEALYGAEAFTAMKRLLAPYGNHYHFPVASSEFLRAVAGRPAPTIWHEGTQVPLDTFAFALLDGEHAADTIRFELDVLLGKRSFPARPRIAPGGIIVVDNIDADPDTLRMLQDYFPARELRDAKWSQLYAVIRVPAVPEAGAVQTSALPEAA
jgi:2-polyprenyl-3-methyl-5-hydroxy-6-metoxy-1,4-benzoquinol methylase/glycosyltransferase involved in cell wall biosynthesis